MNHKPLGQHYLVEYFNCDPGTIDDVDCVRKTLLEAARLIHATVVEEVIHQFNPHGISGVIVIAESHMAIHTWPDHGCVSLDVFSCREDLDPAPALEFMKDKFKAEKMIAREYPRGLE